MALGATASMYPRFTPPAQPNALSALSSNPLALIQLQAQRAVGQAFQGATAPDGSFDPAAAQSAIANNPAAALGAPEATTRLLAARQQNIANATASLSLGTANSQAIAGAFAPIAQMSNPTMDNVYSAAAQAARMGADPNQISGIVGGFNSGNIKQQAGTIANYAMGPGAAASRISGPIGPNGEPTQTSTGAVTLGNPTLQTGMGPQQSADQQAFIADQNAAPKVLASIRPLEQALPLVSQLGNMSFGPASSDIAKAQSLMQTFGITGVSPTDGNTIRQEVNKKLQGYIAALPSSGRSDEAQTLATLSNPNLDLTQPANINLIKNAIGMAKQDAAIPQAAGNWPNYLNFKNSWYAKTDSRGFQPLTTSDLQGLAGSTTGAARARLANSINIARQLGLAQPPTE